MTASKLCEYAFTESMGEDKAGFNRLCVRTKPFQEESFSKYSQKDTSQMKSHAAWDAENFLHVHVGTCATTLCSLEE